LLIDKKDQNTHQCTTIFVIHSFSRRDVRVLYTGTQNMNKVTFN